MATSLNNLLFIVEFIAVGTFLFSIYYHRGLHSRTRDFTTTQEYFMSLVPSNRAFFRNSNLGYDAAYKGSIYHIDHIHGKSGLRVGLGFVHRVMAGVLLLIEDLIPSSPNIRHIFCSLHDFPREVEAANTKAAPSSYHSIFVLSVSTFLWGVYLCLFMQVWLIPSERLKNRSMLLDLAIYSLIFLLSIFGLYAAKHTNIDLDSYYVCIWETAKVLFIWLAGNTYSRST